jgi:hypothetical protein
VAIKIVTLRLAFPDIFSAPSVGMYYDTLCAMLEVPDTYNCDRNSYAYDPSFLNEYVARGNYESDGNGEFHLYYESPDGVDDGTGQLNNSYDRVVDPDTPLYTCCDLFLKRISDGAYVNIYSLIHPTLSSSITYDTALRVSALLFAMASLRRKLAFLRLKDTQAMNDEQESTFESYGNVNIQVDDLRAMDGSETDHKKFNKLSPPFDAIVFMVGRGLLDSVTVSGEMDVNFIATIRSYIADPTDSGKKQAAQNAVNGVHMDRDGMAILGDLLRLYSDALSGRIAESTSQLQMQIQFMQQDTATASAIQGQVENLKGDTLQSLR